jgi:uncharacterized protein YjlB
MTKHVNTSPEIISINLQPNKNFPNSALAVLIYKSACTLPKQKNKAADILQKIFLRNGWSNSWRNGIYNFHHYHSNTHEVIGICSGKVTVILGGPKGKKITLEQGDVLILPAGVGHKCLHASEQFLCIGAYPQGKDYDINLGKSAELESSLKHLKNLGRPSTDPIYGRLGFLKTFWQ